MGAPYSSQSASGYNSNPPADDGSAVASNRVLWSTIKTKLADVLKTLADAINAQVLAAFGKIPGGAGITSTAVNYSVVSGDQGKLVKATASGITITFPDATAVGAPFLFRILNTSTGNITIAGASAQTINGSTSLTMGSGDGYFADTDGSNWFITGRKTGVLPRGYIDGCILANATGDATNDITIAAGVVRDSTNTVDITVAAMPTGKQLDANWAPGDAAGMRNSASGIANTTYHIYAVAKADGTQDIYAHTSTTVATVLTALQAETGGANYIYARLIGSIVRASAAIVAFTQYTDGFILFTTTNLDVNNATPGTSANTGTFAFVPTGVKMRVLFNAEYAAGGGGYLVSSLDQTDSAPSNSAAPLVTMYNGSSTSGGQAMVVCSTTATFRYRTDSNVAFHLAALGYWHPRGKDS